MTLSDHLDDDDDDDDDDDENNVIDNDWRPGMKSKVKIYI